MRKVLVGIIPNPYTERRCGNGKPKEKYTDEVLRYGRRKAADRREDEAASHKAVWQFAMWQEKNMVRQYGQNKMKNIREISVGAILYRHFYFLKVSPKQRPYEDAF